MLMFVNEECEYWVDLCLITCIIYHHSLSYCYSSAKCIFYRTNKPKEILQKNEVNHKPNILHYIYLTIIFKHNETLRINLMKIINIYLHLVFLSTMKRAGALFFYLATAFYI